MLINIVEVFKLQCSTFFLSYFFQPNSIKLVNQNSQVVQALGVLTSNHEIFDNAPNSNQPFFLSWPNMQIIPLKNSENEQVHMANRLSSWTKRTIRVEWRVGILIVYWQTQPYKFLRVEKWKEVKNGNSFLSTININQSACHLKGFFLLNNLNDFFLFDIRPCFLIIFLHHF